MFLFILYPWGDLWWFTFDGGVDFESGVLKDFVKSDGKGREFWVYWCRKLCIYWRRCCCRKGYLEWMRLLVRI